MNTFKSVWSHYPYYSFSVLKFCFSFTRAQGEGHLLQEGFIDAICYGSMRDSLSFPNLCRSTSSNRSRVFTVKTHLWPFAKRALVFTISSFIRTNQTSQSSIQKLAKLASSIAIIMVMDWDSLMTIYVTFQQQDDGGYVIPDCGSPWLHMFILQLLTRQNVLFCIKICTWLSG